MRSRITAIIVAAAILGGGGYAVVQGGGGDPTTANLWVDTNGGTCTRQSTAGAYSDAGACSTFDAAWDAATAGDTIRVKNGSYAHQCITGDKASDTKIIGESKTGVIATADGTECKAVFGGESAIGLVGAHIWLQDLTANAGSNAGGVGIGIRAWPEADDATLQNVNIDGDFATLYIEGDNLEWHGGRLLNNPSPPQHTCTNEASEPLWIFAPGAVIDGITFGVVNQLDTPTPNVGGCAGDGIPHIETVRLEDGAENTTIENSIFVRGSEIGSGHIFQSASIGGFRLINNFFGESADNPMILQLTVLSATGTKILYNTFDAGAFSLSTTNFPIVGNLIDGSDLCGNQNVKNVRSGSGTCGTDTFVGATSLGVDSTGHIASNSPAVDAAETSVCTGADVASRDRDGDTRPNGSVCDAGADER